MTLQLLDDLTSLQVPDIYTIVLASTDDPLAACHRKTAEYTVGIVLVSSVGLEALSGVVIP